MRCSTLSRLQNMFEKQIGLRVAVGLPFYSFRVVRMSKKQFQTVILWSQNFREQKMGSGARAWKLGERSRLSPWLQTPLAGCQKGRTII